MKSQLMSERIQKVLARQGHGSRREIENWLTLGRIKVNGRLAQLGDKVSQKDRLLLDEKLIPLKSPRLKATQILLYHKPVGEICAKKDQKFHTVFERLPPCQEGRWVMVGRLDVTTSGLLLFTNDGELANTLMHPRSGIPRKYLVRVHGLMTPEKCYRLRQGVKLSDGYAKFEQLKWKKAKKGTNQWLEVTLTEGRNREVKRMLESQGCTVTRLIRTGFGKINLPKDLPKGHCCPIVINSKTQVFSDLI